MFEKERRHCPHIPILTRLSDQYLEKPADAHEAPSHSSDVLSQKLAKDYAVRKKTRILKNETLKQRVRCVEKFMDAQDGRAYCREKHVTNLLPSGFTEIESFRKIPMSWCRVNDYKSDVLFFNTFGNS